MTTTVLHGRRKGQSKAEQAMSHGNQSAPVGSIRLPEGPDMRQVTILSKADWDRIQMQLNKRTLEEERRFQEREKKAKMIEKSKEQIKNWNNTVAGQRQMKLEARKFREAKDEEERIIIDIEEARFQAQKRKDAIEKAKTLQYYQTDRVKGFHGALMLTEVLKEREAQIELKRLKESASSGQDKDWLLKAQRDYEEGILRDQEEARRRMKKMKETSYFQKAQMNEHLKVAEREKIEDTSEGEALLGLAAQFHQEKRRLDEIHKQEAKQLFSDNLKQIGDVHRMRGIQKQQEEEEDEECRIFAAAKRKMMKLREEKEKQLHNEKQKKLEMIREKLNAQMQQKNDDEDDRIRRAVEESEARQQAEDAKKEAATKKVQGEMGKHRTEQMLVQERLKREERQKEMEMLAIKREADIHFAKNEEEKVQRRLQDNRVIMQFHQQQMNDHEAFGSRRHEEQLAQDKRAEELLEQEETQFQEYASKVINHCDRGGRNVYPLRKAAREGTGGGLGPVFSGKGGVRPSYMVGDKSGVQLPNYQRGTTDEVKHRIYGNGETDKRLGFVW